MTTLSLERLHLRPAGTSFTTRVRNAASAWSALVARSVEASHAYDRAPTTSARHKVLTQFADTGA